MKPMRVTSVCIGFMAVFSARCALGAEISSAAINSAKPSKSSLSDTKPTPAGVKLQVLLDRARGTGG